jgi:hypothetical protein
MVSSKKSRDCGRYPGLKQRLDHQGIFALNAVSGLNETLHFASIQAIYRSIPRACRFQCQPAPDPLHYVFGLIVAEMMPTPKTEGLLDDLAKGMRDCRLTTQFALTRAVSEWSLSPQIGRIIAQYLHSAHFPSGPERCLPAE